MKKTAIITGASRGIGRAAAETIAKSGDFMSLILTCRENIDILNDFADRLSSLYNINIRCFAGDVGSESFSKSISEYMESASLTPSLLINNAGTAYTGLIQDMSYDKWRDIMSTDLDSVFLMSRMVIPYMIKAGTGRIINISSVWGSRGASCEAAYSAAKGGVNTFTKALAKELAPSGISVNAIAPGYVDTDMNISYDEETVNEIISEIPADRIASPVEIAEVISLVAKAPVYMTGQIISVDGGWQL